MKKLLLLVVMSLVLVSTVLGAGPNNTNKPEAIPTLYGEGNGTRPDFAGNDTPRGPVINNNGTLEKLGLTQALTNVKNENARAAIERNMDRFLEKYQARIQNMEQVQVQVDEETNQVSLQAKEQVKYLGFIKGQATKRFEIQNNGQVTEKQPWYSFMYSNVNATDDQTTE
ncbi:MAG: hypothetical protein KC535_05100 [Nanoarchaeota archaeon]|nr:hypothetical protein [Nanoarchaeota archaeon]